MGDGVAGRVRHTLALVLGAASLVSVPVRLQGQGAHVYAEHGVQQVLVHPLVQELVCGQRIGRVLLCDMLFFRRVFSFRHVFTSATQSVLYVITLLFSFAICYVFITLVISVNFANV